MCSFMEVSRRVFEKEYGGVDGYEKSFNTDIRKRHYTYFKDIAKVLMVEDKLEQLKRGKDYNFSDKGAELLVDLLSQYGNSMMQKDRNDLTKNFEKQVFRNDQYNAFVPDILLNHIKDMMAANNLVILAIETFYQLFVDAGFSDDKLERTLEQADRKFSYSKRKMFQKTIDLFVYYMQELNAINNLRQGLLELTERENAIWLNYANSELEKTIKKILEVRTEMNIISNMESKNICFKRFRSHQINNIEKSRNYELEIQKKFTSKDNKEIQDMIKQYEEIVGCDFDAERFIAIVISISLEETDEERIQLYLHELLGISSCGNTKIKKNDPEQINHILKVMFDFVNEERKKYEWPDIFEKKNSRLRDEELLKKAIEIVE